MLLRLERTVAYICPICSCMNSKRINLFHFSGNRLLRLTCAHKCEDFCVRILPKKGKYKIDISCPICGEVHCFLLKRATFWNKSFISFKCPASGVDIYFLGNADAVQEAIAEQESMLESMMQEEEHAFEDYDLLISEIISRIYAISYAGNLYCTCGKSNIGITIEDNSIVLRCADCGATKIIYPIEECLTFLLNTDTIVLEKEEKE